MKIYVYIENFQKIEDEKNEKIENILKNAGKNV